MHVRELKKLSQVLGIQTGNIDQNPFVILQIVEWLALRVSAVLVDHQLRESIHVLCLTGCDVHGFSTLGLGSKI
jgi:hypothetical protein